MISTPDPMLAFEIEASLVVVGDEVGAEVALGQVMVLPFVATAARTEAWMFVSIKFPGPGTNASTKSNVVDTFGNPPNWLLRSMIFSKPCELTANESSSATVSPEILFVAAKYSF